jgi:hypothetical protein
MLLIVAGVVAYFINHALKPSGWAEVVVKKQEFPA